MSFLKIKDPKERDKKFAEYLQIKNNIHAANRQERLGEIEIEISQETFFKLLIKETQNILQKIPIVTNAKTSTQLPMIMGPEITNLGGIAKMALSKAFSNDKDYDKKWGIRSKDNKYFLGNKEVNLIMMI